MVLRLLLLGIPQIWLDNQVFNSLRSDKARALLFYLAVTGQPQTREHLADLLWLSDDEFVQSRKMKSSPVERARANLRHEIKELRKAGMDKYLTTDDDLLAFNAASDVELDTLQFESAFSKRDSVTRDQLENAVRLYRGAFLDRFAVENASAFENWMRDQSLLYEEKIFQALRQLTRFHADAGRYEISLQYVERWLDFAGFLDEPHQCKLVLLALNHERELAMEYYERRSRTMSFQEETTALYERIRAGTLEKFALDAFLIPTAPVLDIVGESFASKPFQAPPLLGVFVGREDDLNTVRANLTTRQDSPITLLVGMGGIGKSWLAVKAAHELRYSFEDGVLWADLAYSSPMAVLEMWGMAFGAGHLARCRDLGTRSAAFRDLMSNKKALLVLDGAIDLEQVEPLLPNNPHCAVLITTRDRHIGAMLRAKFVPLKVLRPMESLELLISVIGDERVQAEREWANGVLDLLEHLPLALEIAAQRLADQPDRSLEQEYQGLKRANERLKRLSRGKRAVRASFEESWVLLGKSDEEETREQLVFKALGVFEERVYSLEAAAYVAELDNEDDADDLISTLYTLSLVMREGRRRYRLHALLADFARDKLGNNPKPYHRMADYYAHFAHKHQKTFAMLEMEWGNLNAGMRTAYEGAHWPLLIQYANTLEEAWFALGRFTDARRVLGWLCGSQEALQADEPTAWGRRYCQWALACIEQSDYEEAKRQIQQGVDIYEETRDESGIAQTKHLLGRVALERRDYSEAQPLLLESQRLYESHANWVGVADALYLLADIPFAERRHADARLLAEKALGNYQTANHSVGVIKARGLLADIAIWEKDYDSAEHQCLEALRICDEIHEQSERLLIEYILALAYRYQKRYEDALQRIEQSLALAQKTGHRLMQYRASWRRGTIYERMEQFDLALTSYEAALKLSSEREDPNFTSNRAKYEELYAKVFPGSGDQSVL